MKKLIVISDWAGDYLSSQELKTTIEGFVSDPSHPNTSFVLSTPSTIHTTFLASQLIYTEKEFGRPLETVIYLDTHDKSQIENLIVLEESEFIVAHLASGMYVCGQNNGYSFSMIKPNIEELYIYRGLEKGSRFMARDTYARILAAFMDAQQDTLDLEELSSNIVPTVEGFFVGHIAAFNTVLTTIPYEWMHQKYKYDDMVPIKINSVEKKLRFVSSSSEADKDEVVLCPSAAGEKNNPYIELLRGGTVYNDVQPGMKVEVM
jgi:hypothetical protein